MKTTGLSVFLGSVFIIAFVADRSLAQSSNPFSSPINFEEMQESFQKISGFGINLSNVLHHDIAVANVMRRSLNLHPYYNLQKSDDKHSFQLISSPIDTTQYQIYVQNIPVCRAIVKSHIFQQDQTMMIHGYHPTAIPNEFNEEDWANIDATFELVQNKLSANQEVDIKHISATKCLYHSQNQLTPVWQMMVSKNSYSYEAIADENKIYDLQKTRFDMSATVRSYDTNSLTGKLVDSTVDIKAGRYLENDFFKTAPDGVAKAKDNFVLSPSDSRFDEVSSFTNANRQYEYMQKIGYNWSGAKPIVVVNHHGTNNAFYDPVKSYFDGSPRIYIGDGIGNTLRNLGTDADVVAHEFGHHVMYTTVQYYPEGSESLILHEGLSDFFAYSRTGDACLGESICPPESGMCVSKGKCLRSGNIPSSQLSYNNSLYRNFDDHDKGQLINGMLWDLRTAGVIEGEELAKLTLQGVMLLLLDSDFRDFLRAILRADRSNFAGRYGQKILEFARARGFSALVSDIDLSKPDGIPAPEGKGFSLQPPQSSGSSSSRNGGWFGGCASITSDTSTPTSHWLNLLLIFSPFTLIFQRKFTMR